MVSNVIHERRISAQDLSRYLQIFSVPLRGEDMEVPFEEALCQR